MGHETADKRVYRTATRRCNLKEKLQYAGYKQEAVGWNTDELLTSPRLRPTWLCSAPTESARYPPPRVTYSPCGGPN